MEHLTKIKQNYPNFSKTEKLVADFFIHNYQTSSGKPITEVADITGVSKGTVLSFARKLGYQGYRDFILHFSSSITMPNYLELDKGSSLGDIMQHAFTTSINSIENTMLVCSEEVVEKCILHMSQAKRIDFFGMGAGSIIAQDAQQKFLRINKISYAFADSLMQTTVAATLTPADVCVVISYSGESIGTIHIAELAKKQGAFVISITKYSENSISRIAHANLYVSSPEPEFRSAATGSRIAQLCIIDILYMAVLNQDYDNVKQYLNTTREELRKSKT